MWSFRGCGDRAPKRGMSPPPTYVRDRFDNRLLALALALTGIVATMPYIALQLVGMEVVIGALGFPTGGFAGHLPLIIAFVILAAFTYTSGLRAPALIAVVKDLLMFITVIAAVVIIPAKLGGYGAIFASVPPEKLMLPPPTATASALYSAYATLALGSALALFLYPHAMTGILSSSSGNVIRRNAALLPAYSFILGLIALLGYMAIAAGVDRDPAYAAGFARYGPNFAVPALFLASFPSWFVGVAFAGIAIGALVPAAIMSIACANLFTRNLYKEFLRPDCSDAEEARMAKIVSLVVKVGAVVFILAIPHDYAIHLQLLGGIWIIQLLPPSCSASTPARQCAGAADRLGGRHRHRHLHGGGPRLYHPGLPLVDLRRDRAGLRRALFGADQFPRFRRALAAARSHGAPRRGLGRALILSTPQPSAPRPLPHSSIGSGLRFFKLFDREEIDMADDNQGSRTFLAIVLGGIVLALVIAAFFMYGQRARPE